MKENETEYLEKLFTRSSDLSDQAEAEFPLVDVPEELSHKLHAITASATASTKPIKPGLFTSWPKLTSVAAGLVVAVLGFQFYQQQQTIKQLEQAQADLATALHYLGEANRITREQVRNSLNDNMKNSGLSPAIEIELDDQSRSSKSETNTPTRSL